MLMSVPPSRAQSDVFSASQYGGHRDKPPVVNHFIIPVFVLEIIGLACLWALFYYLRFTDVFPYHRRVFHCRDESLMKPDFSPDDFILYVSYEVLYSVSFILPPIVILIGEVMFWLFSTKPRKTVYANCKECKIHLITRRICRFVSVFMFGALIVCIFVDSIKLLTGFQRPYFLTSCRLNYTQCPAPFEHSPERNPRIACLNPSEAEMRYAWLTFPSIFAGLSSFSAIFMSCYVHYMISLRGAPLLRPCLIAGFTGMSLIASFSRIQGYKNHWVDIWVGWWIGVCAAFYLTHNVLAFQEIYTFEEERITMVEEKPQPVAPFFSWFKLPRVSARPRDETYRVVVQQSIICFATSFTVLLFLLAMQEDAHYSYLSVDDNFYEELAALGEEPHVQTAAAVNRDKIKINYLVDHANTQQKEIDALKKDLSKAQQSLFQKLEDAVLSSNHANVPGRANRDSLKDSVFKLIRESAVLDAVDLKAECVALATQLNSEEPPATDLPPLLDAVGAFTVSDSRHSTPLKTPEPSGSSGSAESIRDRLPQMQVSVIVDRLPQDLPILRRFLYGLPRNVQYMVSASMEKCGGDEQVSPATFALRLYNLLQQNFPPISSLNATMNASGVPLQSLLAEQSMVSAPEATEDRAFHGWVVVCMDVASCYLRPSNCMRNQSIWFKIGQKIVVIWKVIKNGGCASKVACLSSERKQELEQIIDIQLSAKGCRSSTSQTIADGLCQRLDGHWQVACGPIDCLAVEKFTQTCCVGMQKFEIEKEAGGLKLLLWRCPQQTFTVIKGLSPMDSSLIFKRE